MTAKVREWHYAGTWSGPTGDYNPVAPIKESGTLPTS